MGMASTEYRVHEVVLKYIARRSTIVYKVGVAPTEYKYIERMKFVLKLQHEVLRIIFEVGIEYISIALPCTC